MAYIPYSPQTGAKYVLVGPDGTRAAFNDPTDGDYVGMLTDVTGLDSAEVRESSEDLVQSDGGQHGNFYYGRRTIAMSGLVFGHTTLLQREARLDKLRRASNAMRSDAVLSWQNDPNTSYPIMQTWVRRQQPLRIGGGWNKDFQLQIVSQYTPIFSQDVHTTATAAAAADLVVENLGDYANWPIIEIRGPVTANLEVNNVTNNTVVAMLPGYNLAGGQVIYIDTLNHTAATSGGGSLNSEIRFDASDWTPVSKGNNTFRLTGSGTTGATYIRLIYRDAWT